MKEETQVVVGDLAVAHQGHPEDLADLGHLVDLGHLEDLADQGHPEDLADQGHPEDLVDLGHLEHPAHQVVVTQAEGLEPITLGICSQRTGSWPQDSPH